MPSPGHHAVESTYRVEVSGWDSSHNFFVEKAELEWDEENDKRVTISRLLCPGTMIFVRLLQPVSPDRACPVAYQAEHIAITPEEQHQFRLKQVQPRSAPKEFPE